MHIELICEYRVDMCIQEVDDREGESPAQRPNRRTTRVWQITPSEPTPPNARDESKQVINKEKISGYKCANTT